MLYMNIRDYLVPKDDVLAYPPGTRFVLIDLPLCGVILRECPCAFPFRHYEVQYDGCDGVDVAQHPDIVLIDIK